MKILKLLGLLICLIFLVGCSCEGYVSHRDFCKYKYNLENYEMEDETPFSDDEDFYCLSKDNENNLENKYLTKEEVFVKDQEYQEWVEQGCQLKDED